MLVGRSVICAVLACLVLGAHVSSKSPAPPAFPDSYEMEYDFSLPYMDIVQTSGLRYPVHVWYDGVQGRLRVDVYNGTDIVVMDQDNTYSIYPRINKLVCEEYHSGGGPTSNGAVKLPPPLPDLSSWRYSGTVTLANQEAYKWELATKMYEKTNVYVFYTTTDGIPLKLHMMGFNILAHSHFDEYVFDFTSFKAGPIEDAVFLNIPGMRNCKEVQKGDNVKRSALQMSMLVPGHALAGGSQLEESKMNPLIIEGPRSRRVGPLSGEQKSSAHQPHHLVGTQGTGQGSIEAHNLAFIQSWNNQANGPSSFTVAANQFVKWSSSQYQSLMLTRGRGRYQQREVLSRGHYRRVLPDSALPSEVDWRGTGADGVVKDQATCGSCWAFAAAGALQASWYLATGESLSLSEQQLVDCSWKYANMGCGGGWMEPAIQYIAEHGGSVQEEAYPYKGQNMYCRANNDDARAYFSGYQTVEEGDEKALMEVLYLHGPVAISLDASQETFRFYSEGVYEDPNCRTDIDHLNHAVMLVGYGTTSSGQDYWIIKNSWSKFWGDDGYMKISRKKDCGITTDPVMALVDNEKVLARKVATTV